MRHIYADMFAMPEERLRVIAPDVGGGFGAKEPFYVEDFLVPWAAKQLDRPVCWIEDRLEHLQAAVHEREQKHRARIGLTRSGEILAVSDSFVTTTGAYVPWGVIVPIITSTLIPGPFKVRGGDWRTGRPLDIVAQVKDDSFAALEYVPRFGNHRRRFKLFIKLRQADHQIGDDIERHVIGCQ